MKTLAEIDDLLRIAIRALNGVAQLLKNESALYIKDNKLVIGSAIYDLYMIQKKIYQLAPDLTPKHIELYEKDEKRYEELGGLVQEAIYNENSKNYDIAAKLYQELLSNSEYSSFSTNCRGWFI